MNESSLFSEILGCKIRFRTTPGALRTIDKYGGLDNYLLKVSATDQTPSGLKLRAAHFRSTCFLSLSSSPSLPTRACVSPSVRLSADVTRCRSELKTPDLKLDSDAALDTKRLLEASVQVGIAYTYRQGIRKERQCLSHSRCSTTSKGIKGISLWQNGSGTARKAVADRIASTAAAALTALWRALQLSQESSHSSAGKPWTQTEDETLLRMMVRQYF